MAFKRKKQLKNKETSQDLCGENGKRLDYVCTWQVEGMGRKKYPKK